MICECTCAYHTVRFMTGPIIASHYMDPMESKFRRVTPEFRTAQEERDQEAYIRRKRRGVVPPKKGQGKRATKNAKKKPVEEKKAGDDKKVQAKAK